MDRRKMEDCNDLNDDDNDDHDDDDADHGDDDFDDYDDKDDDYVELGYLWLSSLQAICEKIARGATYEAISAENVINE